MIKKVMLLTTTVFMHTTAFASDDEMKKNRDDLTAQHLYTDDADHQRLKDDSPDTDDVDYQRFIDDLIAQHLYTDDADHQRLKDDSPYTKDVDYQRLKQEIRVHQSLLNITDASNTEKTEKYLTKINEAEKVIAEMEKDFFQFTVRKLQREIQSASQKLNALLPGSNSVNNSNSEQQLDSLQTELQSANQAISELRSQLDGNSIVQKEFEELKRANEAAVSAHKLALDSMRSEHDSRIASMVSADDLDSAKNTIASLTEQLRIEQEANRDKQDQLVKITESLKQMESAAAGNLELEAKLKKQVAELKTAKELAEQKSLQSAQALANADAARTKELEQNRAKRVADARNAGVKSKVDADADRKKAQAASAARTVEAAKIPIAVQLVPVWQFLKNTAIANGLGAKLGLHAGSVMNGTDGIVNRTKLLGQTLTVNGISISISGVEPKNIWPAIRNLAKDLSVKNYEQFGPDELVQAIEKAKAAE